MDEGTQLAGDLGGPDRVRVGLGGVLDVAQQVGCAQLVADALEVIVILVAVVDDDGAVQVAVDEAGERGQRPLAEEVAGEQVRAGDLQVLLLATSGPGPTRIGVSSPQMTRASRISARIVVFAAATARAARASRACTHPSRGPGPGHRLEDVRAPLDRDVVHHHQEHAPGLEVHPVGHGARRGAARLRRGRGHVHPAAGAFHLVPVVLGGLRPDLLRQVIDLVGEPTPRSAASFRSVPHAQGPREQVLGRSG